MIRALRYALAFAACTLWYGGRIIIRAFRGKRAVPGDLYDTGPRDWGRNLLRLTGITAEVVHGERLRADRPCVYIANHVSFVDIWALLTVLPGRVRFVAKKELTTVPVFGKAMVAAGHVVIDRQNRTAAFAAYDAAAQAIEGGISAIVFAEGTRSRNGRLMQFKKGPFVLAIAAGVPVVPVYVAGSYELMPRGARAPRPGHLRVVIGEEIPTAGLDYEARDALSLRTREAVQALSTV